MYHNSYASKSLFHTKFSTWSQLQCLEPKDIISEVDDNI